MPRFDGTGPFGTGPMGRGMGPCGAGLRGGYGAGFGRGFRGACSYAGGWNRPRWGWGANQMGPQDEVQTLKQQAAYLQEQLEAVQKRLNELEGA